MYLYSATFTQFVASKYHTPPTTRSNNYDRSIASLYNAPRLTKELLVIS